MKSTPITYRPELQSMDRHPETLSQLARPHRKAVLVALLWLTIAGGLLFGWLNIRNGAIPVAVVELVMAAFSGFLLYKVRHTRHLERWILAYLIPFLTAMMIAVATPRASVTIYGWVLLIPLVTHLLLGRRWGLILSLLYIGVAGIIFLLQKAGDPALMDPRSLANMIVLTTCIVAFSHVYEVSRERTELQLLHMAQTDFLTGLANRARLRMVFDREKARSVRERVPLSLLVIDLDHFKAINDQFGHDAGDETLVFFARLLQNRLRASDLAGRLGGEEFGVLLPNTATTQAVTLARELRRALAETPFRYKEQTIPLTMSIGVAELGVDGDQLQTLLTAADQRLYRAKAAGRDQIVYGPADSTTTPATVCPD